MALEFCGYFDSTAEDVREYDAAEMKLLLSAAVQNGVSSHFGGGLRVTADGQSMQTAVSVGGVVIDGYVYVLSDDGGPTKTFTHAASGSADRIDRVVARLEAGADRRCITLCVLEGTPGAVPQPPALTRNGQVHELSLAQVRIRAAAAFVEPGDVTDERGDESVCGYAVPVWLSDQTLSQRYVADEPIPDADIAVLLAN